MMALIVPMSKMRCGWCHGRQLPNQGHGGQLPKQRHGGSCLTRGMGGDITRGGGEGEREGEGDTNGIRVWHGT